MRYIILLFLIIFSFSFSQVNIYNPAPAWVKKGLVIVYSMEGGSATNTVTPRASGSYGRGYNIKVVLDVENNVPYGLDIVLLSGYSTFFYTKLADLSLFSFYVNAKEMNRAIQRKEAPPNCQLVGNPGKIFMRCNQNGLSSKYIVEYDTRTGLIRNLVVSQSSVNGNITQSRISYIKHYYINLPNVKNFPKSAFENHSYILYTVTPMGKLPAGDLNIRYLGKKGHILNYENYGQAYPVPVKSIGVPLTGPHYIHPAWLSRKVLLNVPEAGFEISRDGEGPRGGVVINYTWQGATILQQELDPRTGLLLYQYYPSMGGFTIITELQR